MRWKQYICFSSAVLNKMPGGLFFLFVVFFVCFVCVCVCVHVFYIFIHIHIFVPFVNIANSNSGKKNLILPSSHQPFRKCGKILFFYFFFHYHQPVLSSLHTLDKSLILDTHHCWDCLIQSTVKIMSGYSMIIQQWERNRETCTFFFFNVLEELQWETWRLEGKKEFYVSV